MWVVCRYEGDELQFWRGFWTAHRSDECMFEREFEAHDCSRLVGGWVEEVWDEKADALYMSTEPKAVPEEIRQVDPKTGGQKGQKIERFDLIPPDALLELARLYGVGARKYAENNWRKGYPWSWSYAALFRHLVWRWWLLKEECDPETGVHHVICAAWHCFAMYVFATHKLGTDDRPTKA